MNVAIEINGKIYVGSVKIEKNADGKVFIEGAAEFQIDRKDNETNRIFDDYQLLGWD